MLAKLILIRACTYDLAELDFSHGDAMQLVGGNNVGKSSMIYALNFLFVINRKRMSFMGRKPADKTTMEYYFPTAESSFVVFEISKRGRKYCILVWRDGSGNACYGRLEHAYERGLFFEEEDGSLQPLSLSALRRQWLLKGIKLTILKNNPEIFRTVYHTGKANDAAVWLRSSGHGRGAEGFSKLYRYLIDTRLIDDTALREILLLADHRSEDKLSYSGINLSDIERLRKLKAQADLLHKNQDKFAQFRDGYQRLASDQEELNQMAAAFRFHSTQIRAEMEVNQHRYQEDLLNGQEQLERIRTTSQEVQRKIGVLQEQMRSGQLQLERIQKSISTIKALPTEDFLHNSRENIQATIDNLQFQLTELSHLKLSPAELKARIAKSQQRITQLGHQRDNLANWLIFHLAEKDEDRQMLNALLSTATARLDAGALRKKITSTASLVKLFDGALELPKDFKLPELPTPEQLTAEIAEEQEKLTRDERLLQAAQNRADLEKEVQSNRQKLEDIQSQLQQIAGLPQLEVTAEEQSAAQKEQAIQLETLESEGRRLTEDLRLRSQEQELLREKQRDYKVREQRIMGWLRKLESFQLDTQKTVYTPSGQAPPELERLFNELEKRYLELKELLNSTRNAFGFLRRDLLSETADEATFIEETDQAYQGLDDQEKIIDSLVDSIGQRFANPAADFLHQYELFRDFINQKFNRSLAKLHISNIESLRIELVPNDRLQTDLRKIGELDLSSNSLFGGERGGLTVLRRYIEQGKDIAFSDLFSLQLKLTIAGKEKTVDLSKQVESDGTDRMLRLVIVMQVISRLVDLSPENRIVMFIDEIATIDGKNRPQLVAFCREHHFYPIFAAPEMVEGFDRYVLINRMSNKRLVVEEGKHYVDVERN